jgi:hypothetical protein
MSGLASTIEYVSAKETERCEAALAATLHGLRDEFSVWASAHDAIVDSNPPSLQSFKNFCLANAVPFLPARPATVCAYVITEISRDAKAASIRQMVAAIDVLHDNNGFAPPGASSLVRFALGKLKPVDPPRSWTKDEMAMFTTLPAEIQSVIHRRDKDREKYVRNEQNKLAQERKELKELKRHDSAETKPVELEKETINGEA